MDEFSQLKMALHLPLNEFQCNLNEKELVVVVVSENTKYYIALLTLLLTTQTLKEPEIFTEV